jgi:hypothetical protein
VHAIAALGDDVFDLGKTYLSAIVDFYSAARNEAASYYAEDDSVKERLVGKIERAVDEDITCAHGRLLCLAATRVSKPGKHAIHCLTHFFAGEMRRRYGRLDDTHAIAGAAHIGVGVCPSFFGYPRTSLLCHAHNMGHKARIYN